MGVRKNLWWAFAGVPRGLVGRWGSRAIVRLNERGNYENFLRVVDATADDDVLDVGCGTAVLLARLAGRTGYLAGLDASELQVEMARGLLSEQVSAGTAEIVLGDAAALPWPDGRFSVVMSLNCLKFVPKPSRVLSEIHRVLRPGGRAVLTVSDRLKDGKDSGTQDAWGQWRWSATDASRLMTDAGFTGVSASVFGAPAFQLVRGLKEV